MSWSHIQHNYNQDGSGTTSLTWSITISAVSANSAVSGQFVFDDTGGASVVNIKSDKGDTALLPDTNSDPGNQGAVSFAFPGLTAGVTVITATLSIAAGFVAFSIDEDNPGAGLVPVLDGHNTRLQTGLSAATNNITTNAFTTSANGALIKASTMCTDGRIETWAAGTGFTARNNVPGAGGDIGGLSEDLVQSTAGSITPTITVASIVGGFPINVLSFGMAFKAVASASPVTLGRDTGTIFVPAGRGRGPTHGLSATNAFADPIIPIAPGVQVGMPSGFLFRPGSGITWDIKRRQAFPDAAPLVAVTSNFGAAVEFIAGARADSAALLEFLASIRADGAQQIEAIAAVRSDTAGWPEFVSGLSSSAALNLEFLGSMRGDSLGPLEIVAAFRSDVVALTEILAGSRSDAAAATEILAALRSDLIGQVEILGQVAVSANANAPIEITSAFRSDQTGQDEITSAFRSDTIAETEEAAGVASQSTDPIEDVAGVQSNSSDPIENLGGVQVAANSGAPIEITTKVTADSAENVESTGAFRSDAAGTVEDIAGVSRSAGDPIETVAGVQANLVEPIETLGVVSVAANTAAQVEIIAPPSAGGGNGGTGGIGSTRRKRLKQRHEFERVPRKGDLPAAYKAKEPEKPAPKRKTKPKTAPAPEIAVELPPAEALSFEDQVAALEAVEPQIEAVVEPQAEDKAAKLLALVERAEEVYANLSALVEDQEQAALDDLDDHEDAVREEIGNLLLGIVESIKMDMRQ